MWSIHTRSYARPGHVLIVGVPVMFGQ